MSVLDRLRLAWAILRERSHRHDPVFVQTPGALPRVERVAFLLDLARDRRVLHLGFLDTPFLERKIREGTMLHRRLHAVARDLYGVDIDAEDLARYRALTGDLANLRLDLTEPAVDLGPLTARPWDYVFLPEVLEHLADPATALRRLHRLCAASDARLVITVPNAFSLMGVIAAAGGREVVHPDHFFYFSPVTLSRLVTACGFTVERCLLYGGSPTDRRPGLTDAGVICVCRV